MQGAKLTLQVKTQNEPFFMEKIFGILAYPAGHSLSPVMHSAGFKALSLPYGFNIWDVQAEELGDFMRALKSHSTVNLAVGKFPLDKVEGFSVSMPHKESIIPLLDGIDEAGNKVGAISCVYMRDGKFIGTNLDYIGVRGSLESSSYAAEHGLAGKKVIVLGAGGAAKAAVYGVLFLQMIPVLFNRTLEKAVCTAKQFAAHDLEIEAFSFRDLEAKSKDAEIIINCTPLGLGNDEKIVPDKVFSHIKLSLDAVYSSTPTIFQTQSALAGAENLTGLEWLLHQGFEAFRLWTGKSAPKEVMRKSVVQSS